MSAGRTSNGTPMRSSSSRRRGEAEARTSIGATYSTLSGPPRDGRATAGGCYDGRVVRRPARASRVASVCAAAGMLGALAGGCGGDDAVTPPRDAATAPDAPAVVADAAPARDGAALWVEFAAAGCDPVAGTDPGAP